MEDKLRQIFAQVLMDQPENIAESTSQDTHSNWDSLNHLNLVMSLEAEFGVKLEPEEVMSIRSFADALSVLRAKGVTA